MLGISLSKSKARRKLILPPDEPSRLASLYFLGILDSPPQEPFDRITRIAQRLFAAPIAIISFVDADRDWFKSSLGVDESEMTRAASFSSHTILVHEVLVVPDARADMRFFDNPLVRGSSAVRFYAGCPVRSSNGANIGALSIMDVVPRTFTEGEKSALQDLAATVEHEIGSSEPSLVDELTGLMNRRGLSLISSHIVPRASRNGETLSMLSLDIKGLDDLNREFGRSFGDSALIMIADVLHETLRSADIPARMRGDDFAILLPDTEKKEASALISRIQREIQRRQACHLLPSGISLRISQATLDPSAEDFSLEGLIAVADLGS